MTLDQILNQSIDKMSNVITINGSPVWDYKEGNYPYIYLISEDPWEGAKEEYVTIQELLDFCNTVAQRHKTIEFATEADQQPLTTLTWKTGVLELSHF
jgi:hypothetical protein